jgi:hypothetical protein
MFVRMRFKQNLLSTHRHQSGWTFQDFSYCDYYLFKNSLRRHPVFHFIC